MFTMIYIEEEIREHPTVARIREQFKSASSVFISRYTEIFNRSSQHFRLQKEHPALILAKKHQGFIHETPPTYGIGRNHNYYFSHVLNCPFDCKYCFLQAMYRSAHYVYFVNHEDFQTAVAKTISPHPDNSVTIFTGYDGDSLALESITHFIKSYYSFFSKHPHVTFELRTKSSNIHSLLELPPLNNVVIAYSLNPSIVAKEVEIKAPSTAKRLECIGKLQQRGWNIGLRFDPIISFKNATSHYLSLFQDSFSIINHSRLHSVTLGHYRLPPDFKKKMESLLPHEPLIHSNQEKTELLTFCKDAILKHVPQEQLFLC
ncbi:MAG: DNA photolyase [Chlamydiales bacterium]|nr:DNA photolyase [Chlamydiales bacterium]